MSKKEKPNDEELIRHFLGTCNSFHEFRGSLVMPLYKDENDFYEYVDLVDSHIKVLEFITNKITPILKENKRLCEESLKRETQMEAYQKYFFEHAEELGFFHQDFFIHTRILMDRIALLSSFLFSLKNKQGRYIGEHVDNFTGLKQEIDNERIPEKFRGLIRSSDWYNEYLKAVRDGLIVHCKDVKHRLIGKGGSACGGNADVLDGLCFLQAYPSKIKEHNYNDKQLLRPLIGKLDSFLTEYIEIIKEQNVQNE